MQRLVHSVLIALYTFTAPVMSAADTKPSSPPPATKSADKPTLPGQYKGTWKSTGNAGGGLQLKIGQNAATWTAEASFTFEGTSVSTRIKSLEVTGARIQLIFDWESEGAPAQSILKGELTGDTLQGTYESKNPSETSTGTWIVTRV